MTKPPSKFSRFKTWLRRGMYGYVEYKNDSFQRTLQYYYPSIKPQKVEHPAKWWGKIIVWVLNFRLTKLTKLAWTLIVLISMALWAISDDVIKEKSKPFISSFIDGFITPYPPNNGSANHSNNDPIKITGTVETAKNTENISAHKQTPEK